MKQNQNTPQQHQEARQPGLWDNAPVLSYYSPKQAVEDGINIDAEALDPDIVKDSFTRPWKIVLTDDLYQLLKKAHENHGCPSTYPGMLWDIMTMYRHYSKKADPDSNYLNVICVKIKGAARQTNYVLNANIQPYDANTDPTPCLTFGLVQGKTWRG